jgi:hypothetical protein
MNLIFEGEEIKIDAGYTDRKGEVPYDYPSGTYAYDVTDYIYGSGTHIAVLENTATESKKFSMAGLGLLLIYENKDLPEIEYWIDEGCDMLNMKKIGHAEEAVTSAKFNGNIDTAEIKSAKLITIVPFGDKGANTLSFNDGIWGKVWAGDPYDDLAIDERDVTDYILPKDNIVRMEDDGDYMVPSNAFLVIEYEKKPKPASTPSPSPAPISAVTPSPIPTVTPTIIPTPTKIKITPTPTPVHTPMNTSLPAPSPKKEIPSFEAIFAIVSFLVVYLVLRKGGW